MGTSAPQVRAWQGPALFGDGFRPFFLGAAAYAAFALVVWVGTTSGTWNTTSSYDPVAWRAHEFLWG